MEMCLRLTAVVLLTVAVMGSSAPGALIVHVVPRKMHLSIDSCVTLYCCAENITRSWVQWWFNPSVPSPEGAIKLTEINYAKSTKTQQQQEQEQRPWEDEQNCAVTVGEYKIVNASKSGWYFCNVTVDIPVLKYNYSNGAEIVLTKSLQEHSTSPSLTTIGEQEKPPGLPMLFSWWIWVIVGVSCLIVVVLLIACILKRRPTTREVDCPIYSNTHPPMANRQPSPQPRNAVGNMKAESTYQNAHTPNFGRRFDNDRGRYK